MGDIRLFDHSKIDYDDYLKNIQQIVTTNPTVSSKTNIAAGVEAIIKIDDPIQRQKLIDTSILVDQEMVSPRTRENSIFKKLPVIMTLATIIGNHSDQIGDLNNEQLVLLGQFSYTVNSNFMKDHLKIVADNELLQSVIDKTKDKVEQQQILSVVKNKYFEKNIDKEENISLNNFKNEMILMIRNSSKEELLVTSDSILKDASREVASSISFGK